MSQGAESELVSKHHPCKLCGSSDAAALYSDGHLYCFKCSHVFRDDEGSAPQGHHQAAPQKGTVEILEFIEQGTPRTIKSRAITAATAKFYDYRLFENRHGEGEHHAVYRDPHGTPVGVKVRNTGEDGTSKDITWGVGSAKGNLWGRHLFAGGGQWLAICEGEIDAMSLAQMYALKRPVVSVPNGAGEAAKAVAANLEWINTFQKVIIVMDMDQPGRDAAVAIAKLLPPGKAFIAKLPLKDPSEMLMSGKGEALTLAVHTAEAYRPDGILDARTLTARCLDPVVVGIPWPWEYMTQWTYGRRDREVYTFGSGTGMGKSDLLAEVVACDLKGQDKAGNPYAPEGWAIFGYEGGPVGIKKQVAGKIAGKRFHIPPETMALPWTPEELRDTMDRMDGPMWESGGKLFINDSFGAADWEAAMERTRYLAHAEGIKHFLYDPISAYTAGDPDERKSLDKLVLEAASLANELDIKVYLVSHLTRPSNGPSHEEGGHVALNQFRGSNAIGMFSSFVFGLERDQQAETEQERATATIRVVKDRYTGNSTGKTDIVVYDSLSGLLDVPAANFIGDV
ncbi:MAG: toprim domain-containing protein [Moraxellaceae bacterium]